MEKIIIKSLNENEKIKLNIAEWSIWEKEESIFDYTYDETEYCLFIEGEVIIGIDDKSYFIKSGDFVTFVKGLECTWDIKKKVKKHYSFE